MLRIGFLAIQVALLLAFFFKPLQAQDCRQARALIEHVNSKHLEPLEVNDNFAKAVFRQLLSQLDPDRMLFTRIDSIELSQLALLIDDQINAGTCEFMKTVVDRYRVCMNRSLFFVDSMLQKKIDFHVKEVIPLLPGVQTAPNYPALKLQMGRRLKLEILQRASRLALTDNQELTPENFNQYEPLARQRLRSRNAIDLARFKKEMEVSESTLLSKVICQVYDPHTEYFSESEMEAFNTHLRSTEKGFGFEIDFDHGGQPLLGRLQPGGPAWKSKVLTERDVLISFTPANGSPVDFADLDDVDILNHINDPSVSAAGFMVKKSDGRMITVNLAKEKVENTENLISSFVLKDKIKVGYLALPGFYTTPEMDMAKGCSEDVAREVIKLKKDGIQGLILDLRFNGGGSLREALDLAGLFVDVGPIGIFEIKGQPPTTLRDANRGLVYDGPLLILVNGLSASASEFIAAALQDYNRALIVGSQTYGKSTGQEISSLPVNGGKQAYTKVTVNRLYRIGGNTLQQVGVMPDIVLPDYTAIVANREAGYSNSLQFKTISKKVYFTPLAPPPREKLMAESKQRLSVSEEFAALSTLNELLVKPIPLDLPSYLAYGKTLVSIVTTAQRPVTAFSINPSGTDQRLHVVDAFHQQISEKAMEEIKQSAYIREAFLILQQWLQIR